MRSIGCSRSGRSSRWELAAFAAALVVHAAPLRAEPLVYVEPDDYGRGAAISHAVPGVTLSVEGRSAGDPDVVVAQPGAGRASTGERVFGYHRAGGGEGFTWRDDVVTQAFFVAELDAPSAFVAIDVVRSGGPGETADPGILWAYDAAGDLLDTVQTPGGSADFETLLVTRPVADVAAIRVTGVRDPIVLDNLRFEVEGDSPPPSCESRLQSCEADLVDALEALDACEGAFGDEDGDGEVDPRDACPATPPGEAVDAAGCSRAQFCAAQAGRWAARCHRADWRNDEPLRPPRDCRAVRTRGRGWGCEPR